MYKLKVVGLRAGHALVWTLQVGEPFPCLHRLERLGNRLYSRVVLWGSPEKWPPQAVEAGEACVEEPTQVKITATELVRMLAVPPPCGSAYPAVLVEEPPIIKGFLYGIRWDVDLTKKKP